MGGRIRPTWGDWGTYMYEDFIQAFNFSPELMRTPLDGVYSYHEVIEDMLADRSAGLRYSDGTGVSTALAAFASSVIPHRLKDFTGRANICNPYRDTRKGVRPSVPSPVSDVFKPILLGDPDKGHAIVAAFDQDADVELDDLMSGHVDSRPLGAAAHAATIVNRFPAYVRLMDEKLERLLDRIGFTTRDQYRDGKHAVCRTIPFGMNLVSFPFADVTTLSTMTIFDLYSTLKATQRALARVISVIGGGGKPSYDVFFNIGPLAGGTIQEVHCQAYVQAGAGAASVDTGWSGILSMRDFVERDVAKLTGGNRSWQAYIPPIREGRFDVRIELKDGNKEFIELSDVELWDLAEVLVFHSNALDMVYGIPERNIQLFPTGAVVRPFAVDGGHEKMTIERVYGQPAQVLADRYNGANVQLDKGLAYRMPTDTRGADAFSRLVDLASPILQLAA